MDLLEYIGGGPQIVAEIAHLSNSKSFNQFAPLCNELLMAGQPCLAIHLPLLDEAIESLEFRGRALAAWSEERGVRLEFIQPGKPAQNAYAESFNGRLRDECLNANWFTNLSDARRKIESWRQDYNQVRPHSSLDYLPPAEFARTQAEMRA
jgi:hypothetical protein